MLFLLLTSAIHVEKKKEGNVQNRELLFGSSLSTEKKI